jgi:hypothetical protein
MKTWARVMPHFRIQKWDETNSPMHLPFVQEAYRLGKWSKVASYVRLSVLHQEGGVYLDTDVEVLKPFDPLLEDGFFLSFDKPAPARGNWALDGISGSAPGHPFPKACMQKWDVLGFEAVNAKVVTDVLLDMGLTEYNPQTIGGVRIYPTDYFYPVSWIPGEGPGPKKITANTYCIHHYELSWQTPAYRRGLRRQKLRNMVRRWLKI